MNFSKYEENLVFCFISVAEKDTSHSLCNLCLYFYLKLGVYWSGTSRVIYFIDSLHLELIANK